MQFFKSIAVLALAAVAAALPTFERRAEKTNFYLVATPTKSAHPANTTGIDLFDPYYQAAFLLRAQPDAGSYVQFNLTKGILSSMQSPAHDYTDVYPYESNIDATTGSISFTANSGTKGLFSFKSYKGVDYLAYNGKVDGFTACVGDFEQTVINYNGTDASCVPVYLFQQKTSPTS